MKVQKVNGIQCRNPLSCMIITFLHELTHLIIFAFCIQYDTTAHPKIFQNITKSLFGHTSYKHELGIDSSITGVTREELKNRKYISFFTEDEDKKPVLIIGKIDKINISKARVTIISNYNKNYIRGRQVTVSFFIINKEEPRVTEKDL